MAKWKLVLSADELNAVMAGAFPGGGRTDTVRDVSPGRVHMVMPYNPLTLRPGGLISGPTQMSLADSAAYVLVMAHVGPELMAVTSSLTMNFLRGADPGDLHAEGPSCCRWGGGWPCATCGCGPSPPTAWPRRRRSPTPAPRSRPLERQNSPAFARPAGWTMPKPRRGRGTRSHEKSISSPPIHGAQGHHGPGGAGLFEDGEYSPAAEALDKQMSGALKRAVGSSRFKGSTGQTVSILAPSGTPAGRVIVVGAGKQSAFDAKGAEDAGAHAYNAAKNSGAESLLLMMPPAGPERQAHAALGIRLASYRFDKYRTTETPEKKPSVKSVSIAVADVKAAGKVYKSSSSTLADAITYARDLVSEPANILYPEEYARRVKKLESLGLTVEVLGVKEMKKLGMGALLGVGQGSVRDSQLAGGDA